MANFESDYSNTLVEESIIVMSNLATISWVHHLCWSMDFLVIWLLGLSIYMIMQVFVVEQKIPRFIRRKEDQPEERRQTQRR